jgi:hypothetical protein
MLKENVYVINPHTLGEVQENNRHGISTVPIKWF